jgi:hypothetical protein
MLIMQGIELEELQYVMDCFPTVHKIVTTFTDAIFGVTQRSLDSMQPVFRKPNFSSVIIDYDAKLMLGSTSKNSIYQDLQPYEFD